MLLTITTTHRPANDLGYLLHKHPDRMQTVELAFGNAHGPKWRSEQTVLLRNISTRPVFVRIRSLPYAQGAAPVEFHAFPSRFRPARESRT